MVAQAKKREKKKNAAKEPVPVEPAKKVKVVGVSGVSGVNGVNGVSGQGVGVNGGKDSPVSKRAGGAGKDKGGRVAVQRSPVLGKKVRWVCSVLEQDAPTHPRTVRHKSTGLCFLAKIRSMSLVRQNV